MVTGRSGCRSVWTTVTALLGVLAIAATVARTDHWPLAPAKSLMVALVDWLLLPAVSRCVHFTVPFGLARSGA